MNHIRSLFSVLPRMRPFWLLVILAGTVVAAVSLAQGPTGFLGQLAVFACGALIGFACSAFFSLSEQFVLRGCRDVVYLVANRWAVPRVYELRDRATVSALGGIWHEVTHVSDKFARVLFALFGKGELNLRDATLHRAKGENSVFAVLLDTRYGIPNPETLEAIWGPNAMRPETDIAELDKRRPGRDLVSVQYWPDRDRPQKCDPSP